MSMKKKFSLEIDKELIVEKELIDKCTLWMLRVILKLGGYQCFLNNNSFANDEVALFLDLEEFVEKEDLFTKSEILCTLNEKLENLEKRVMLSTSSTLKRNITQISKLMNLSYYEEEVLEFSIILREYDILEQVLDFTGNNLNTKQTKKILSQVLDIPKDNIDKIFSSDAKLTKSSILSITNTNNYLTRKLIILSDKFSTNMLSLDEDIDQVINELVKECSNNTLVVDDYKYIQKDLDILIPYLDASIKSQKKGVNVLFYGLAGTGKTELSKTIANCLHYKLYEISYSDELEDPVAVDVRMRYYQSASELLQGKNHILMYDEAEDIFESNDSFFASKKQKDKLWINRMLETNSIPTIWITNDIRSIDNAIVRRFDMTLELPIPPKSIREQIIKKYSSDLLDKNTIERLCVHESIAPALISSTAKVIKSIECDNKSESFERVINNTLVAQGHSGVNSSSNDILPNSYDPSYVNTTIDLKELTSGIKDSQNARICLYGPAGTGKSAFGRYIAESLDKPILMKKGSDLVSKWLGETEKNIAAAFFQAQEEDAILVFDEVDSFLSNREDASKTWEVTQVNEMLVQMENFDGIFIATTNLMENLDKASLRRFDLKLEFGYLKSNQAQELFIASCKELFNSYDKELTLAVMEVVLNDISNLCYLTPGDFSAVIRQNRFRPIEDVKDFVVRLEDEIAVKNLDTNKKMGFL